MDKIIHPVIKCDTEENWKKAKNYVPAKGTFIFYEYEDIAPKMKFGDGKTLVNDLAFVNYSEARVENDILEL